MKLQEFFIFDLENKMDADVFVLKNMYDSTKSLELYGTDPV